MNIYISRAKKLYEKGFTYRFYQEHFHKGMVFYCNDSEWVIGGDLNEKIAESDLEVIKNGIWLPSETHLMEWLMENEFKFNIVHDSPDMGVTIHCEDTVTGTTFSPTVSTLEDALACVIIKILKKGEREFDTKEKEYVVIDE